MITALVLFNPEFALWALLILGSLNELDELLIIFVENPINTELFAGHSLMVLDFAIKAVDLPAQWAVKLCISFQEVKHVFASC